jgi:glycosyltransferase involved in cell wall biosynthesis
VQEVMRQIAERMVAMGHDVTVATSRHRGRKSTAINGVKIRDFRAGGKMAHALYGEINQYRQFVQQFDADAILIMAAQQWSFDALWPVLDHITARKVFIPCGFSCLYEPDFAEYFRRIPEILRKFDHFIFNAERYRDIDFVRQMGLTNFTVLPNGVSEVEFEQSRDPQFRRQLGISDDAFVFLTVGNPIEAKGHREVIDAFARLDTGGRSAVLICIANWPRKFSKLIDRGVTAFRLGRRVAEIAWLEGWVGIKQRIRRKLAKETSHPVQEAIESRANNADAQPLKRVILTDLQRPDLVQAYMTADLFIFASKIEYSPLVLFEAAAAGVPFLAVPVGNAEEIVRWTGGGVLCTAIKDARGYTRVDPEVLAQEMSRCMKDQKLLSRLGATARERWRRHFTWQLVAGYYEAILSGRNPDVRITDPDYSDQASEIISGVT